MSVRTLYGTTTGCSDIIAIEVDNSHNATTATAVITARDSSLIIGEDISVSLGYTDEHQQVFTGFVKQIERKIPEDVYVITAKDKMQRAVDYFFASSNPETPFSRSNIQAEDLVADVLAEAGLTGLEYDNSYFTFATGEVAAEVNLVSAYDYANGIADLLAYNIWCDIAGHPHFENRKPYPMDGDSHQPGDDTDETGAGYAAYTFVNDDILGIRYKYDEKDLRNRVVVYGASGVYAEAHQSSPYLPSGFYKSAVLSSHIITSTSYAQDAANYNLHFMNRLTYEVELEVIGKPSLVARGIYRLNQDLISGINVNWYMYSLTHRWSQAGYICSLVLRK